MLTWPGHVSGKGGMLCHLFFNWWNRYNFCAVFWEWLVSSLVSYAFVEELASAVCAAGGDKAALEVLARSRMTEMILHSAVALLCNIALHGTSMWPVARNWIMVWICSGHAFTCRCSVFTFIVMVVCCNWLTWSKYIWLFFFTSSEAQVSCFSAVCCIHTWQCLPEWYPWMTSSVL